MSAPTNRVNTYSNAISIKIPNRRLTINDDGENGLRMVFKICDGSTKPRSANVIERNRICVTILRITKESAWSLLYCLMNRFGITEVRIGEDGIECLKSEIEKLKI
jgi:hypothetical protein